MMITFFSEFFFWFWQGTNFKFKSWEICRDQMTSSDDSFITLEATDPATGSVLSFQTLLSDFGPRRSLGVRLLWINLASRIEPIRKNLLRIITVYV